jgi:hypothetical protein
MPRRTGELAADSASFRVVIKSKNSEMLRQCRSSHPILLKRVARFVPDFKMTQSVTALAVESDASAFELGTCVG